MRSLRRRRRAANSASFVYPRPRVNSSRNASVDSSYSPRILRYSRNRPMGNRKYGGGATHDRPPNAVSRAQAANADPWERRGASPRFFSMFTSTLRSAMPCGLQIVIDQRKISGIDVRDTVFLVPPLTVIGCIGPNSPCRPRGISGPLYPCMSTATNSESAGGAAPFPMGFHTPSSIQNENPSGKYQNRAYGIPGGCALRQFNISSYRASSESAR